VHLIEIRALAGSINSKTLILSSSTQGRLVKQPLRVRGYE